MKGDIFYTKEFLCKYDDDMTPQIIQKRPFTTFSALKDESGKNVIPTAGRRSEQMAYLSLLATIFKAPALAVAEHPSPATPKIERSAA